MSCNKKKRQYPQKYMLWLWEIMGTNRSELPGVIGTETKENQVKGTEARGMVHALVGGETNQNLNNMEDDINA
ncbi:hypothetical protein Tco_0845912 [Tanacetum coccineum]